MTDSSQAAIPGATVTVTNVGTNAQRTAVTDGEGRFSVPALPPATYHIKVELQGFQTAELPNFVLRQGETARPTITLGIATVTESVTVTGEAPLLQTQSASVGQVINEKQIEDLPLNGRTVLSLASLSAGVTPRNFARNTQFGRRNQFITVEGGRDSSTNYTIDGVYVRSLRFNNLSLNPPIDAVQEVSLLRNSFSTEYGQGQAVVSIVTKSGTNQLHGSAYEFYRGDRFDAKNFFAPTKPEYKRNQFGATGGGPIMRNKVFVFGAYEGLRTIQGQPFLGSVPSQAFLSGNFSALATPIRDPLTGQPFPGNIIPREPLLEFRAHPDADDPGAEHRGREQLHGHQELHRRREYRNGARGPDAQQQSQPVPAVHVLQGIAAAARDVQRHRPAAARAEPGGRAHVGAVVLLGQRAPLRIQLRVPPERADQPRGAQLDERPGTAEPRGGDVSARVRAPGPDDGGLLGPGRRRQHAGRDRKHLQRVERDQPDVRRPHAPVRHAGAVPQVRAPDRQLDARQLHVQRQLHGQFRRRLSARLLLDLRRRVRRLAATYNSPTIAPFIDDNWQVNDKLSLQLGLRWEYLAPWAEQNGMEAAFDAATGKIGYNALPTTMPAALVPLVHQQEHYFPDGILQKDLNNWAPRVGVAYNLTDRMVVRSGFGVYYDNLNLNELQFTRLIPPYYGQFSLNPPVTAPLQVDTLFPDLNNIPQFPAPFSLDPTNRTPYTMQWNVNVQRSLGRDYLVEAAYTGSRSRNLHKRYNINQADFGTTPINSRLPFPQFQPAMLYSSADRLRRISRASRCGSRSATPPGCSSSPTISCRRTATTVRARSRRTTPRSGPISMRTRACRAITSAIAAPSASATSCRSAKAAAG